MTVKNIIRTMAGLTVCIVPKLQSSDNPQYFAYEQLINWLQHNNIEHVVLRDGFYNHYTGIRIKKSHLNFVLLCLDDRVQALK